MIKHKAEWLVFIGCALIICGCWVLVAMREPAAQPVWPMVCQPVQPEDMGR